MRDVSIIIVNWNGRDLLARCLQCVETTIKQACYEIIVVDNGSTDGSQEMLKRDFPQVKRIENTSNVGFARANNQAMEISQGRYVLLLNSDAFVKDGTVDTMVAFMDAHPEAGMAACKLLYEDGRLQPSCSSFPTLATEFFMATRLDKLFPKSRLFGGYLMTYWNFDSVREVDSIMGAFMLVRASAIQQVGRMDERYFMYSEEADWCYQFKKVGWKIYFVPDPETVHLWGGSATQVATRMHVELYRSRVQFFRKNYGAMSARLLKLLIGFSCVLRLGPGLLRHRLAQTTEGQHKYQASWRLLTMLPGL
jgi:GT2 family glycosyltransferase